MGIVVVEMIWKLILTDILITGVYHQTRGPYQLDQMIGMGMNPGPKAYHMTGIMNMNNPEDGLVEMNS